MSVAKNQKNILVTRSKNDSFNFVKNLNCDNLNLIFEPLFQTHFISQQNQKINFSNSPAIIVTSSRAFLAVESLKFDKKTPIFAVGEKTADIFRRHDFENVICPKNETAQDLKELILSQCPKSENLIYFHGSKTTLDFKQELSAFGYQVENILAYQTKAHENFSAELISVVKSQKIDAVVIFSKHSGEIFFDLCQKHNLLEYFKATQIFCLSSKISQNMMNLGFRNCQDLLELPQFTQK